MEQVFFKSFEMKASEMWIPWTAHTLFLTARHKTFWASPSGTQKEAEKKSPEEGQPLGACRTLPAHHACSCSAFSTDLGAEEPGGDVSVPEYSSVAARA